MGLRGQGARDLRWVNPAPNLLTPSLTPLLTPTSYQADMEACGHSVFGNVSMRPSNLHRSLRGQTDKRHLERGRERPKTADPTVPRGGQRVEV